MKVTIKEGIVMPNTIKPQYRVYRKIIVSFICLLAPVFLLITLIFVQARQTIREEVTSAMSLQLNFFQSQLDEEINRVNRNLQNCLTYKEIGVLSVYPGFLDQVANLDYINRIQQRMVYLINSSSYIEDAYVMIPQAGRKIAYTGLRSYSQDEYDDFDKLSNKNTGRIIFDSGKLLLCASYPYNKNTTDERRSMYLIVTELSQSQLTKALAQMQAKDGSSELFFYREDLSLQISMGLHCTDLSVVGAFEPSRRVNTPQGMYLAVYAYSSAFDATLCQAVPESIIFSSINRIQSLMLLMSLIAVTTILSYMIYLYRLIHRPLNVLIGTFGEMERGKSDVCIQYDLKDEFGYIYRHFNTMADQLNNLIQQVYLQKILMQKAHLKQLQSQINPHFLYNSFFILGTLSRTGDYETLEDFTDQLGDYYRFLTRNAEDDILLSDEVRHARTYAAIQARRFSNRITVCFDELPVTFAERLVPRLILQPIIENAFLYGIEKMESNGRLWIRFVEYENALDIQVENNGNVETEEIENLKEYIRSKDDNLEVTGLTNIHRRLELKFGEGSGLDIKQYAGNFRVIIHIDFGSNNSVNRSSI